MYEFYEAFSNPAHVQQGKKAFGHSAARIFKAKLNMLEFYLCLKNEIKKIARNY